MSICLSVNLNKIALIRNSRAGDYPSVTEHARLCIEAGADGITVHPRPDQRQIRAADVPALAAMLAVELNVEGNPGALVWQVRPRVGIASLQVNTRYSKGLN